MNSMIFIDTCIVIDYINGKISIEQNTKYCFNSIVDMEVLVERDFKFIDGLELK